MRIGTWNLAGRYGDRHRQQLEQMACDVLLLTEVSEKLDLTGWHVAATDHRMTPNRHWSAIVATEPILQVSEPHPASIAGTVSGIRYCSSILPWRGCSPREFWVGANLVEKMTRTAGPIEAWAPQVWGGDWNQSFIGRETAGTLAGRRRLTAALERLGLQLPTALLPHRLEGIGTIDHIAVPATWAVLTTEHIVTTHDGARLSDHDAYVVEVEALAGA